MAAPDFRPHGSLADHLAEAASDGPAQVLAALTHLLPLDIKTVASGERIFDWIVPHAWSWQEAYVADATGRRLLDARSGECRPLTGSRSVRQRLSRAQLELHLQSLPSAPERIPEHAYTAPDDWGFALPHHLRAALPDTELEVVIESSLESAPLHYGELFLAGEGLQEAVLAVDIGPQQADAATTAALALTAQHLLERRGLRYGYRILFLPGSLGALAWLARREPSLNRVAFGLALAGLGGVGPLRYQRTYDGGALTDRLVTLAQREGHLQDATLPWTPGGDAMRQLASPGFGLPVGVLSRAPLLQATASEPPDALAFCARLLAMLEADGCYRNVVRRGEPDLARRGVLALVEKSDDPAELLRAVRWLLASSDGAQPLSGIAARSGLPFTRLEEARDALLARGLLAAVSDTRLHDRGRRVW